MKFNLDTVERPAVITKAVLSLYNYYDMGPDFINGPRTLYKISRQWKEKEATWNKATASVSWTRRGGDYTSTAVVKLTDNTYKQWEHYVVTSAIIDFHKTPATNYGFLLKYDRYTPSHNSIYIASDFIDSVHYRPKLTITVRDNTAIIPDGKKEPAPVAVVRSPGAVRLRLPFTGTAQVSIRNTQGRQIAVYTVEANNGWIEIPAQLSCGVHLVSIKNATTTMTVKLPVTN